MKLHNLLYLVIGIILVGGIIWHHHAATPSSISLSESSSLEKIPSLIPSSQKEDSSLQASQLTASIRAPVQAKLWGKLGLKDMSKYNLGNPLLWKEPGVIECEPWGPGMGYAPCLPGTLEGDPPCPIFQDCDGDGHYWWKGEDCDENCPTCYVGSPYTTSQPDGRDQDCDGIVDDQIECVPVYGSRKYFGYDSNCNWTYNTLNILVNEGEMGEIPTDELHCKKIFGQCTSAAGGWGNCVVSKTPGYFVKSSGINCGGGVWRAKTSDALFYCGKALRENSYKGEYGCGGPCDKCYPVPEKPQDVCTACDINSTFDYPRDLNGDGIVGGPWGLCHGYNTISCQVMTGCKRKITTHQYH